MHVPTIVVLDETEDLGRQVARAIAGLRPRPELVLCPASTPSTRSWPSTRRRRAHRRPSVATPPACSSCAGSRLRLPDASLILVFDRWRTAGLRDTIRTGAVDILRLPVADEAIVDAILQALEVRWGTLPDGPGRPGRAGWARSSPWCRPPAGAARRSSPPTWPTTSSPSPEDASVSIDLDLQFGELSTALRLKPSSTIIDLLPDDDERATCRPPGRST